MYSAKFASSRNPNQFVLFCVKKSREMEMEKKLYEATLEGSVTTLKTLIQEDPLILDRISLTFFHETPLHISILRGHVEFARELLTRSPQLVTEPDGLGHTPLHLAAAKGEVEIVRELLRVRLDTCLVRSKEGKLPLHLAIMKGDRVQVVKELARACPESTRLRVDTGDTALHLCVKYENLDALQVLVEFRGEINGGSDLLNARNDDGNTVLHLAALHKNLQIMKYLLSRPSIELNAINNNGLTPLDLIENSSKDIKGLEMLNFLLQSNAQRATNTNINTLSPIKTQDLGKNTRASSHPSSKTKSWKRFFTFSRNNHLENIRGELLIAAAIVAAVTGFPIIDMKASGPDMSDDYPIFTLSFVPAVAIMVLLVSGFSLRNKLCVWLIMQLMYTTLGFFGLNFIGSMISHESRYTYFSNLALVLMIILFGLLILVSVLNLIRLIVWVVTSMKARVKRKKMRGAKSKNGLSNA